MADETNGLFQFTGFGTDGPVNYGYTPTATYQTTPGMGLTPAQNALVDPSYLAQLEVLNRPQTGGLQFAPMGSGVANVQGTGAAPAYPTMTQQPGAAATGGNAAGIMSGIGGGSGGDYPSNPNPAWSNMTPAEQAAYYAANPTMASITQALQTGFGYTTPGLLSQMVNPQGWGEATTIARGMDPTGMQFGSPGLSIGGLQIVAPTVPDLTPQNYGIYGWEGGDIGTGVSTPTGYYTGYDVSSNSGGDWSDGNGGGYADSYGSTSYGGEAYGDMPSGTY